jgi:glutaredoxin
MQFHEFAQKFKFLTAPSPNMRMLLVCAGVGLACTALQAQNVYRSVDANGRVIFSDMPPLTTATKIAPVINEVAENSANDASFPLELRQVVGKFPVTLYTSSNCAPCDGGRRFLSIRGVPFSEKTVNTAQDAQALKSLSGSTSLPFLTIGGQHVEGYSSSNWTQYLNAAGYPEHSKLPANYIPAPAAALVSMQQAASATEQTAPASAQVQTPVAPVGSKNNPDNPAGIQF